MRQIRGKVECFESGGNYIFYSVGIYAQNVMISKQFHYCTTSYFKEIIQVRNDRVH